MWRGELLLHIDGRLFYFFSAGLILYDRVFIFYEDSLFTVGNLFRIFISRKLLLWKYEILLTNALRVTSGVTCWRMQFQHVFFWCGFADFFHSFNYSFSDNVWESTHLVLPKTQLHLSSGDTHVFFIFCRGFFCSSTCWVLNKSSSMSFTSTQE